MGFDLGVEQIDRTGIRGITPAMIEEARQAGERWKLICTAVREGELVKGKVAPQRVKATSHMYSIRVSGSAVEFDLDIQPGLGIYKDDSGPDTTAYGLLADMINALRGV
jgi:homoserine dehydrogenase